MSSMFITEEAAAQVKALIADSETPLEANANTFIRLYVAGGGCSGLRYGMNLDNIIDDNDLMFEDHGVNIVVDDVSLKYVEGSTIGFAADEMGGGFTVDNPNKKGGCGCGKSFNMQTETASGCGGCSGGTCG